MKAKADESVIGTVIAGKYEIKAVLGEGGMSVVYRGYHTLMQRSVAIKMLHSRYLQDEESTARFQLEAQAASRLNNPNVITVHDFGITEEGRHYLVMDFVEGESLAELLDQLGPIPADLCLDTFTQVCNGLHHAHENGIVHRDLKPGNIMIVKRDGQDIVKVVDFGVAKMIPREGTQMQQLTHTGEIFGTSLYLSPEQCQGKPLDRRSDIYAFGCVMYETLTGLPPFIGTNLLDTMQKHINEPVPRFAETYSELNIPLEMEEVIFRALAKHPDERYQSMAELKQDLELAKAAILSRLSGEPGPAFVSAATTAPNRIVMEPFKATLDPTATFDPAATLDPAAMLDPALDQTDTFYPAATLVPLADSQRMTASPQAVPASAGGAGTPPAPDPGSAGSLPAPVGSQDLHASSGHTTSSHKAGLPKPVIALVCIAAAAIAGWTLLNHSPTSQPPGTGGVVSTPGQITPVSDQTAGSSDDAVWRRYNETGQASYDAGKYAEAEKQFVTAMQEAEKFGETDKRYLVSLRKVSDVYYIQGKDLEGDKVDQQIKTLRQKSQALKETDQQSSDRIAKLAQMCHKEGQCDTAESLLKRSLEIAEKAFGKDSPQAAERLNDLAAFYMSMGLHDQAEPLLQRVMASKKAAAAKPVPK